MGLQIWLCRASEQEPKFEVQGAPATGTSNFMGLAWVAPISHICKHIIISVKTGIGLCGIEQREGSEFTVSSFEKRKSRKFWSPSARGGPYKCLLL